MGGDQKKGETYLNYVVPEKYGDSNGFQAGSTFKAFVLSAAIKQGIPLSHAGSTPRRRSRSRRTPSATATATCPEHRRLDPAELHREPARSTSTPAPSCSVNTFFAQLEQRTGLCEPVSLAREMGVDVARHRRRRRRSRSASPTPTR